MSTVNYEIEMTHRQFLITPSMQRWRAVLRYLLGRYLKYLGYVFLFFLCVTASNFLFDFHQTIINVDGVFFALLFFLLRPYKELELMTQMGMKRHESFWVFFVLDVILAASYALLVLLLSCFDFDLSFEFFNGKQLVVNSLFLSLYQNRYVLQHTFLDPCIFAFLLTLTGYILAHFIRFVFYGVRRIYQWIIIVVFCYLCVFILYHWGSSDFFMFLSRYVFGSVVENSRLMYIELYYPMCWALGVILLLSGLNYLLIRRKDLMSTQK